MFATRAYTTIQKYGVSKNVFIFYFLMNTFIQQVCINLNLKSDSECIYTGKKKKKNKCCSPGKNCFTVYTNI